MLNLSSYVILGLLSKSLQSGYELKRILAKSSSFYGSESNAQIYPVLKRLENQGLVNSMRDETSGARNKRIYEITQKGQAQLIQWLESDAELSLSREEFLLQLSLGQHLAEATLVEKLNHYSQSIVKKLTELDKIISHLEIAHTGKADQRYLLLTYDHLKVVLTAKLAWCDKVKKEFSGT